MVAGVGVSLLVYLPSRSLPLSIAIGVAAALVLAILHGAYQETRYGRLRRTMTADPTRTTLP